jgi:hypothetical protein
MRVRFLIHGVANHVLLRQRGFNLDKPKLALTINMFLKSYSNVVAQGHQGNIPKHET